MKRRGRKPVAPIFNPASPYNGFAGLSSAFIAASGVADVCSFIPGWMPGFSAKPDKRGVIIGGKALQ